MGAIPSFPPSVSADGTVVDSDTRERADARYQSRSAPMNETVTPQRRSKDRVNRVSDKRANDARTQSLYQPYQGCRMATRSG
jgi:hypothetical protein